MSVLLMLLVRWCFGFGKFSVKIALLVIKLGTFRYDIRCFYFR